MPLAKEVPGTLVSSIPDDCSWAAVNFATAIRNGDTNAIWHLLSKESRAMQVGVWAVRNGYQPRDVYGVGERGHPLHLTLVSAIAKDFVVDWASERLESLAALPARYLDNVRAWARVATGITEPALFTQTTAIHALLLPMIFEDGAWRVHVFGYGWPEQPEDVEIEHIG
jgi:hypothetical protein